MVSTSLVYACHPAISPIFQFQRRVFDLCFPVQNLPWNHDLEDLLLYAASTYCPKLVTCTCLCGPSYLAHPSLRNTLVVLMLPQVSDTYSSLHLRKLVEQRAPTNSLYYHPPILSSHMCGPLAPDGFKLSVCYERNALPPPNNTGERFLCA